MTTLRLVLKILRGSARRDIARLAFMLVGLAVSTFVLMLALAVPRILESEQTTEKGRYPITAAQPTGPSVSYSRTVPAGRVLGRMVVTGPTDRAPLPPGLKQWPRPGHSAVSPGLAEYLRQNALPELGKVDGIIEPEGLATPDEWFAWSVVEGTPAEERLVRFGNPMADTLRAPAGPLLWGEILALIGLPAGLFIAGSLRMSFVSRLERFSALSLIGASPRALSNMFGLEMLLVAAVGYASGWGVFALTQPVLGRSGIIGSYWWPEAAELPSLWVVALAIPILASIFLGARLAMRRQLGSASVATHERAWQTVAGTLLFLGSLGYSSTLTVLALARRASLPTSDTVLAPLFASLFVGVIGLVLLAPRMVRASARILRPGVAPTLRLGLNSAAHHAGTTRRQVGAVVAALAVAAVTSSLLSAWRADALTDPAHTIVQVSNAKLTLEQRVALLALPYPKLAIVITDDPEPREVVIADCADVASIDPGMFDAPEACTGRALRGRGAPPSVGGKWSLPGGSKSAPIELQPDDRYTGDIFLPRSAFEGTRTSFGILVFAGSTLDGSLSEIAAAIHKTAPGLRLDYGVKDTRLLEVYTQQILLLRAGVIGGGALVVLSLITGLIELRWASARSVRAQFDMGISRRTLRASHCVSLAAPFFIVGVPALALVTCHAYAMLSIWGWSVMANSGVWVVPGELLAFALIVAVPLGWVTGFPSARSLRSD